MALLVAEYAHSQYGILNNVYARIGSIDWQDTPGVYITVYVYASQEARLNGKQPLDNYPVELPVANILSSESGNGVISDAYGFIKNTVERFLNSVDV